MDVGTGVGRRRRPALILLSDERLAQLAAGGSDAAFATLYRRYSSTLFGYCRSITRSGDDAWDALQNAMVKVLIALRRGDRAAAVRPWLFCIAHNESIGVLRRRASADRVAAASHASFAAGADEQAETRERMAEVVSDVQELPTGQRAALVMRELADLPYDEIAIALDTTEGNARQLVFAARAGLKDSRAGRGLPCESVRDQLTGSDGRLLRRRSVRAHLRTCAGCSEFAAQPARALGVFTPLAGSSLLEAVLRAGAVAAPGGGATLLGSFGAKAATVAAVAVAGLGVADVAHEAGTAAPAAADAAAPRRTAPPKPASTAASAPSTARTAREPAVAAAAPRARLVAVIDARPAAAPRILAVKTPAAPERRQQHVQQHSAPAPPEEREAPRQPAPAPARAAAADCPPHEASVRYEPRDDRPRGDHEPAAQQQQRDQPTPLDAR